MIHEPSSRRPVNLSRGTRAALQAVAMATAMAALLQPATLSAAAPNRGNAIPASPTRTTEEPFVEAASRVRPAVAAIGSYHFKDQPTVRYYGTGFVVHDGKTVVTNAHVIEALRTQDRIRYVRVFFPGDRPVDGREASVWSQDDFHDLALLRFEGPGPKPLELSTDSPPPMGRTVGVVGYPIGLKLGLVPATHRGVVAAVVPAVLPLPSGNKLTPDLAEALTRPYDLYQLDLVVYPGNSGSPLFDARNGRIVGIINKTLASKTREHLLEQPSGISYAVPSRWIRELIKRSTLTTNPGQSRSKRGPGTPGD